MEQMRRTAMHRKNSNDQSFETDADPSVSSGADVGNYPNNYIPDSNEKIMISSFDTNEVFSTSYAVPKNGEFYFFGSSA